MNNKKASLFGGSIFQEQKQQKSMAKPPPPKPPPLQPIEDDGNDYYEPELNQKATAGAGDDDDYDLMVEEDAEESQLSRDIIATGKSALPSSERAQTKMTEDKNNKVRLQQEDEKEEMENNENQNDDDDEEDQGTTVFKTLPFSATVAASETKGQSEARTKSRAPKLQRQKSSSFRVDGSASRLHGPAALDRQASTEADEPQSYVLEDGRPSPLADTERLRRQQRLRQPNQRRKMVHTPSMDSTDGGSTTAVPWEFDTNRFASQRGTGGFGSIRRNVMSVHSSRPLSQADPTVNPLITTPPKQASQVGMRPFGAIREQVTHVIEHVKERAKRCSELSAHDRRSDSVLKLWNRPNPQAKNEQLFGTVRPTVTHSIGGRKWTSKELAQSRAAIPRLQRVRETSASRDRCGTAAGGGNREPSQVIVGFLPRRQATMSVIGLDRTVEDQLNSNKHMSWLGSQLCLQTQSKSGGFGSHRDVTGPTFYERLTRDRDLTPAQIFALRQKERERVALRRTESEMGPPRPPGRPPGFAPVIERKLKRLSLEIPASANAYFGGH